MSALHAVPDVERFDDTDRALAAAIALFRERQLRDEPWIRRAACFGLDVSRFFPGRGRQYREENAAVCDTCQVRTECLEYAERMRIRHGVWGGESERSRRVYRGWGK